MPSSSIIEQCQRILGAEITNLRPISGGDISKAYLLQANTGQFFLKTHKHASAGPMFEAEAMGLALLDSTSAIRTPSVIGHGSTADGGFLLLEYIEQGIRPDGFWERFGEALANLHLTTAPAFGLDHDNYIGSLPQRNCQCDTWATFYTEERLLPQLTIAEQKNTLQLIDYQRFEQLLKLLPDRCPIEPPALVHGDLWSGNFLCSTSGEPVLIDPAVSFAHREMDLAMSRLFGGFERPFYRSYEAAWPLEPGFEQRLPIYQLYYLLVHVNLFGGGYLRAVREALDAVL